ncbi:ATP-binding cassette domain-containing protein [Oceanobacillus luteolus]|uniref:ATP-binding cassette domain-containing protein n=1 Tax=Oceanobacillus luteolus TaxID=1274358 RepID=A0ABW4HVP3_9BACI
MEPILTISNLEKTIEEFHLGPIDISFEKGTITALVGNNGSGKSTLLKSIMNLVQLDRGLIKLDHISINGEDESWKKLIAYQPQTVVGWDPFTGTTLKKLIAPLYPHWDEGLFHKMVKLFDIPLDKKFGKLSQGVQQKLNLALTIPRNAPLLILDEPTSFMDIPSKKILMDLLVDWMEEENRTLIIASHQVEDIRKLADFLFVLHNGKMIGNFEKEELMEKYARYWFGDSLPAITIPGEVVREDGYIISCKPRDTETYLKENKIEWRHRSSLELEDIITILLTPKQQNTEGELTLK